MDKGTLCELLECSVCLESFNEYNNKVLPCQHTFCRFCLDAIVAVESRLVCPECRLSVDTKVDDLPSNVLLNRILSTLKNPLCQDFKRQREKRRKKGLSSLVDYGMKELNVPCAKALYNYKALEDGDLSFRNGDVLELLYKVDENWFVGRLSGKQGFVPSNYIQVLCPLPPAVTTCRAKHDFSFKDVDWKNNCLSFKKDDLVAVIREVNENWLEGCFHDKVGLFPKAFVELDDNILLAKLGPNIMNHLLDDRLQCGKYQRSSVSMLSSNDVPSMASSCNFIDGNESRTALESTSNSYPRLFDASESSLGCSSEPGSTGDGTCKVHPVFDGDGTLPLYQALLNYFPKSSEELNLEVGKMYVVLQDKGGGWLLGKSVAKGTVGLFPSSLVKFLRNWNYVEKIDMQGSLEETKNTSAFELFQASEQSNSKQTSSQETTCNRKPANEERGSRVLPRAGTRGLRQDSSECRESKPDELSSGFRVAVRTGDPRRRETDRSCGDVVAGETGASPSRGRLGLSSVAYGVSSLVHRNVAKRKTTNERCASASASRRQ